uniref:p450 mono-oxygenase n=1 Tax=Stevia rebaudiana TaxID=55670 RepID=Q309D0_STERE|nr:P450 mono-oxygenase [Stevia rebaudiana]
MEFHLSLLTTVTAILVVTAFFLQISKRKKVDTTKNKLLPPKAKGAWPLIGHLPLLGKNRIAHRVLGDLADKYGPIFTIKLGVYQVLVVSSADAVKDCFTTSDKAFASRPKSTAVEIMGYNYAMFGLAPYGEYWRQVRKIAVLEILSQKRVDMLEWARVSEVRTSTNEVYDAWRVNKENEGSDMVLVDMKQWFTNLILNVLVRIISGKRFPFKSVEGIRFQKMEKKLFELLGAFVVSDLIPSMKRFDIGGYQKQMKMAAEEINDIMEGWLNNRKTQKESGEQKEGDQYFMDVLISVLKDASDADFPGYDHDTVIKATCMALLAAGSDTTSVTIIWALALLLNHPEKMKIAQDEIDKHVGRDRLVEESDLKNLVYINAIIKETMRLYPAAPLSVPHEAMEDCVVGGYHIPKGTRLLPNFWKIQHDPNIWPEPYEFKPERFLSTHKDVDVKGKHFELLPFGTGRRMCPAITFVLQILPLTLANLIQQFEIRKPSNDPIDMTESAGLTTKRATPLDVLIAPRLSLKMYPVDV